MEETNINYEIKYRNIKNPRLEFKGDKLKAIVPFGYDADVLINKYRKWIFNKSSFIEECHSFAETRELSNRSFEDFALIVSEIIQKLIKENTHKIININFRKMKSRWASIRIRKDLQETIVIYFNKKMQFFPEYLIEYIVFHEINHLKEKKHSRIFRELIKEKYKNFKDLERELLIYSFKIL